MWEMIHDLQQLAWFDMILDLDANQVLVRAKVVGASPRLCTPALGYREWYKGWTRLRQRE